LRLVADENLHGDIVPGVLRRIPGAGFVRVQDIAGLSGSPDVELLAGAAREGRALVTHDVTTMTAHARGRMHRGEPMSGVFQIPRRVPLAVAIEDLVLLIECSHDGEWDGQVRYLPL